MDSFQPQKYTGRWFDILQDKDTYERWQIDCITKEFAMIEEGDVDLYFRGRHYWQSVGNQYRGVNGVLYRCDEGSATTQTCMATMGKSTEKILFKIFQTDFITYDLSYHCYLHNGKRL